MKFYCYYLIKDEFGDYTSDKKTWTNFARLIKGKPSRCSSFNSEEEAKYFLKKKGLVSKGDMKEYLKSIKEITDIEISEVKEENKEILIYLEPKAIYCDGTHFNGNIAKSRVTNVEKKSLIKEVLSEEKIFNDFLKENNWTYDDLYSCNITFTDKDIAFAEAFALYLAMEIAIRKEVKIVYSDCTNAINNWSLGKAVVKGIDEAGLLIAIYDKRKQFEKLGGEIRHIAGEINPADFGKHPIPYNVRFTTKKTENSITVEEYYNKKREFAENQKEEN